MNTSTDDGVPTRTISGPATGLRSLELIAVYPIFIQLAGPDLLDLKCLPNMGEEDQEMPERTVSAICKLTSLTSLSLYGYQHTTRLSALQGLKLRELRLDECTRAAQQILPNGRMSTLEKLYIRDREEDPILDVTAFNAALRDSSSPDHKEAKELHQLGQMVLSLPRLVQLSGSSLLFSGAMAEELRAWSEWKDKEAELFDCWYWNKLA